MQRTLPAISIAAFALVLAAQEQPEKFIPPTAEERRDAVGALGELTSELVRAFDPADHFEPLGEPQERDWLRLVPEPGQTYDEFLNSRRRRLPTEDRGKIYILPLGEFPAGQSPPLETLREFLAAFYELEVVVREAQPLSERFTTRINEYTQKPQILTGDVFDYLVENHPRDAFAQVALTMQDLYPREDRNYTFGQGGGSMGVYSFARFDPSFFGQPPEPDREKKLLERSLKVMIHEVGHLFGLRHCIYYLCLMGGANNLEQVDSHPLRLCPVCLRKVQSSLGFDVQRRYERLRGLYARHGFDGEVEWLDRRLEFLEVSGVDVTL